MELLEAIQLGAAAWPFSFPIQRTALVCVGPWKATAFGCSLCISWDTLLTALSDQPEILELFFDHGAAPGFTDEVYALSATIVQLLWRHQVP